MSEPLELLPEGTILNEAMEIWRQLAATPAGQLYLAVDSSSDRPVRRLLLARPTDAPPDLRQPGETTSRRVIPALLDSFTARGRQFLTLGAIPAAQLATVAPLSGDEAGAQLLAELAIGVGELRTLAATSADYRPELLALDGDGRLVYLGPVTAKQGTENLHGLLVALADHLLAPDTPRSVELAGLLAGLREVEFQGFEDYLGRATELADPRRLATRAGVLSIAGAVRPQNEDAALHLSRTVISSRGDERVELIAVADGMGGHRDGETAARVAVTALAAGLLVSGRSTEEEIPWTAADNQAALNFLAGGFAAADEAVCRLAEIGETSPPATTLVCGVRLGRRLFCANVGDSRAYLLRGGVLERLTRDDSVVQDLIDCGAISVEQSYGHPQSHAVTQCLGCGNAEPRFTLRLLRGGDVILFCSDGVTEQLRDDELGELVATAAEPREVARQIVQAAAEAGSNDNLTALVMIVEAM